MGRPFLKKLATKNFVILFLNSVHQIHHKCTDPC